MAKLFTKANMAKLIKNASDQNKNAIIPVVKVFTPDANMTWLFSEYDETEGTLFGLADLGFGTPELGYVSLAELTALRGQLGLPVERERYTTLDKPLVEYAEEARLAGVIKV